MPWKFKNSDEEWGGDTHELAGRTFTGATRTSASQPLIWVECCSSPEHHPQALPERQERVRAATGEPRLAGQGWLQADR